MTKDAIDAIGATLVRLTDGVTISESGMHVIEDVDGEFVLAESIPTDATDTACLQTCLFYQNETCRLAGDRSWGCGTNFVKVVE